MQTIAPRPGVMPQTVLLVGFQDQDNLGVRYLMSAAGAAGHRAELMTYGSDADAIGRRIASLNPDVVGFSLIFQYMAPDFARVIAALRAWGVTAHFTIGGHYPSFAPGELLQAMPGLDSVVRFEGERTLARLLDRLGSGSDWRGLSGIAYRRGEEIVLNPLAEPVSDLDSLPPPDRDSIDYASHVMPTASVLGSRGCPWNCTFCSIRPFYEAQGGALRRLRDPHAVASEIRSLHSERGVSIFLFQDDDFLAGGKRAKRWAVSVADALREAGLAGRAALKISCRSDEIEEGLVRALMAGGLTHIYMGVESGEEQGLAVMGKRLKPEAHFRAARTLKGLGLSFDFGFMLLEPYSTIDTVRNNIAFLESFIGDGWSVSPFCRMLPYAGTPIEQRLRDEDRLLGTDFEPDYRFLDPKLDLFYDWMVNTFYTRNFTDRGLCHLLRGLLFEARLRLDGAPGATPEQRRCIQGIAAVCNRIACYTLRRAIDHIDETPLDRLQDGSDFLAGLTAFEWREEERLMRDAMQYQAWVHPERMGLADPGTLRPAGGFARTWTFAAAESESRSINAA